MTTFAALGADADWPDHSASTRAHDDLLGNPRLGRLGIRVEWLAGTQGTFPPNAIQKARLIIFAADHGIAAGGVSALAPGATAEAVREIQQGSSPINALAEWAGAGVRVLDLDVVSGRIDVEPALTPEQVADAVSVGVAVADEEVDAGADLLIAANLGAGSTTSAAALISVLTGTEPVKVIGRGGRAIDDFQWMHKLSAIRDARLRGWPHSGDPSGLLGAIGGADVAALAGFLLRAAVRRTPVLLDGVVASAAAVLAAMPAPQAARWFQPAQLTGEPAQVAALARLDLEPMLDLGMTVGDGSGGLLALGILRAVLASIGQSPP